ncbi:hypothetical protein V8E54_006029 [Elaphomyces granulatus]
MCKFALFFTLEKLILRVYVLGHITSTAPRLFSCLQLLAKKDISYRDKAIALIRVLGAALAVDGFPTFCAAVIGGSTVLPMLFSRVCTSTCTGARSGYILNRVRLVRFFSAFLSAWLSFLLLNRKRDSARNFNRTPNSHPVRQGQQIVLLDTEDKHKLDERRTPQLAGRTLDLTLFAVTRAADVIACIAWSCWRHRRQGRSRWTSVETLVPWLADVGVFAGSAAVVMWTWFYIPDRLPRSYEKWIKEVAKVDTRLIEALRRARRGDFVYGKDTGQAELLGSMCEDYNWPIEWGNPLKTIPIPCEMVHMGTGPSCEWHAVSRFLQTFKRACATYLPLQLLLRTWTKHPRAALVRATKDATRSSFFLALFVSTFYYSVCLARTRLGPKLLNMKTVTPMMWDSGLCIAAGCLACGWSIFAESAHRRQEIALFVAPRAVATTLPRRYAKQYQYREQIAFALSTAIILTTIQEKPEIVRGFFGKIIHRLLAP